MELGSLMVLFGVLAITFSQSFDEYNSPWGYGEPGAGRSQMGQRKAFPDPGKVQSTYSINMDISRDQSYEKHSIIIRC